MTPEQAKAASRKEKEAILIEMASDLMLTKTQQKLAQRKLNKKKIIFLISQQKKTYNNMPIVVIH